MLKFAHIVALSLLGSVLHGQSDLNAARQYLEKGDYILALEKSVLGFDQDTTNTDFLLIASTSAFKLGDYASAKKYYHKLEKLDSTNVDIYIGLASIYEQQQRLPRAVKYYTLVNKLLPNNSVYFRKNASLYASIGEYPSAFRLYSRANELNSRDVVTLKGLAEICISNEQMELADSLLEAGLKVDEENISLSYLLAKSKYKQKQYDSVTIILNGLQGMVDLNGYYNKLLGYSYLQIDSVDLAIQKLGLALVEDPTSENLHYYLGSAYEKQDNLPGALVHFEKAVEFGRNPDLDLFHRNAGRIAHLEKDYKTAIAHYQSAYRYKNDPLLLYHLATISDLYYKDKSIAINYYSKYLKSKHSDETYKTYANRRSNYLKEQTHFSK